MAIPRNLANFAPKLDSSGNPTFTAPTVFSAGTASNPSITFTGDTNTGLFSPAGDTIAFAEGGVEAARINSSGDFLVGTTSSAGKLTVAGGIATLTGGIGLLSGTAGPIINFNNTDIQAGYVAFRCSEETATAVAFFSKSWDGTNSLLVVGSVLSGNTGTIDASGNLLRLIQSTGTTCSATWVLQRIY